MAQHNGNGMQIDPSGPHGRKGQVRPRLGAGFVPVLKGGTGIFASATRPFLNQGAA